MEKKSNRGQVSRAGKGFTRVAFPPERKLVLDTLHLGRNKPMMHGFLELDVTRAREQLAQLRKNQGQSISFTAFILACLGRAVAAHPEVHALRDYLGRVVLFEDVDSTTIVEVEVQGRKFALAQVMRDINRRSVQELSDEIRQVQAAGMGTLSPGLAAFSRAFLCLPGFLRRPVFRTLLSSPGFARQHTGTVLVSSVGMFNRRAGWGLSAPGIHNLSIILGGITVRPGAAPGSGPREVLCLTVSANHDLVDGAPLARFTRHLTELIEGADLLRELDETSKT